MALSPMDVALLAGDPALAFVDDLKAELDVLILPDGDTMRDVISDTGSLGTNTSAGSTRDNLGNFPVVFTNSSSYVNLPESLYNDLTWAKSADFTCFAIVNLDDWQNSADIDHLARIFIDSDNDAQFYATATRIGIQYKGQGTTEYALSQKEDLVGEHILTLTVDVSGVAKLFIGGTLVAVSESLTAMTDSDIVIATLGSNTNAGTANSMAGTYTAYGFVDEVWTENKTRQFTQQYFGAGSGNLQQVKTLLTIGDSITSATTAGLNYPDELRIALSTSDVAWREVQIEGVAADDSQRIASGGETVATTAASISSDLAGLYGTPEIVVIQLGSNDVASLPAEATWIANYESIIDAVIAKYPNAKIYINKPWRNGYDTESDTIAGWIDTVIASYPNVFVGADWRGDGGLESTDAGATYLSDGVHPNAAGVDLLVSLLVTAISLS